MKGIRRILIITLVFVMSMTAFTGCQSEEVSIEKEIDIKKGKKAVDKIADAFAVSMETLVK